MGHALRHAVRAWPLEPGCYAMQPSLA